VKNAVKRGPATFYVYDAFGQLTAEYANTTVAKEYIRFGGQVAAIENIWGRSGLPDLLSD